MSFNITELIHIISTIDDLLSMSEPPSNICISTGYNDVPEDDEDSEYVQEEVFIKLVFSLKNSNAEIRLYDSAGILSTLDYDGEILKEIEFDDNSVSETSGSFKKALKKIRDFDRQYTGKVKTNHIPIDRSSFGLVEVN